jgi:hypothetical protein
MRPVTLLAACAALAAPAAGCARGPAPTARTALDCPVEAGKLKRASVAADGRSCRYADRLGDQVELRLLPATGGPEAALAPIRQALAAELAPASADAAAARKAQADAAADAGDDDSDSVDIALPGLHVSASHGDAQVQVAGVHVDADQDGAVVQSAHAVKMRGNPFVLERRGYMARYMISRDTAADGFVLVGYEAGGPQAGPLTVAVVRATGHDNGVFAQAKRLVRRNGGV